MSYFKCPYNELKPMITYNTRPHTFRYHTFDPRGRIIPGNREQAAHFYDHELPEEEHKKIINELADWIIKGDVEFETLADKLADYHNKHGSKPPKPIKGGPIG